MVAEIDVGEVKTQMTILFKISSASFQKIRKAIAEIADMRSELKKNYPDIVVNVEVEVN